MGFGLGLGLGFGFESGSGFEFAFGFGFGFEFGSGSKVGTTRTLHLEPHGKASRAHGPSATLGTPPTHPNHTDLRHGAGQGEPRWSVPYAPTTAAREIAAERAARVLFHPAVPGERGNLTTRALPAATCSLSARPSPAPRRSPLPRLARSRRAAIPPSSSARPTLVAWGVRGLPPRSKRCRTRLHRVSAPAPPPRGTTLARWRTAPPPRLRRPPAAGPRRTPS